MLAECLENLPDAPVHLHHHVAKQAGAAFALKLIRDKQRHMNHRMGHVEEKRIVPVLLNELHRAFRVLRREQFLILAGDLCVNDLVLVDQRQVRPALEPFLHRQVQHARMVWPHIVRVRQPKVIVEPVLHWQELFVVAKVPFAIDRGGIPLLLAKLGQRHLIGVQAVVGLRTKRPENSDAHVVAAGQQPRSRGTAYRLRYVKVGEFATLLCHAIEVRRWIGLGTERPDVRVGHVVHEDDDQIGGFLFFSERLRGRANSQGSH